MDDQIPKSSQVAPCASPYRFADLHLKGQAGEEPGVDQAERIVTCVFCGMAYPAGTPRHGEEILYEHIKTCPKHPLRAAEAEIQNLKKERDMLRQALVGVVGSDDPEELEQMRVGLQVVLGAVGEGPDRENVLTSLRAIEVLLSKKSN